MDKFVITGGHRLKGEVTVSGAKNAVVAILPATILAEDVCRIENIPNISDVTAMLNILSNMGASIKFINNSTIEIDTRHINSFVVEHELSKQLRASYYLIGALLGRFNKAKVAMPGGCYLGVRPIDQHIKGFEALGAEVTMEENAMVNARAESLLGNAVYLDVVSVGATINVMLAAVKAKGLTIIENAAKEPHIVDLANFLNTMGADVRGAGTDVIKIRGVEHLHGCEYSIIPDQIEAGTYMAAAAAVGGDVTVDNVIPKHLDCITAKLREIGADITEYDDAIRVESAYRLHRANVKTMPYPGFPTDMQPQITVCLATAVGTSLVTEGVYDNRFRYTAELGRMGANIQVEGKTAIIDGVQSLHGCEVRACDLRAGAAMVIAAMCAEGTTLIEDAHFIERGYEDIVGKLTALGASIRRVETFETPSVTEDAG